jgi:hypothetical protein
MGILNLRKPKSLITILVIVGILIFLTGCFISLWYYATHTGSRSGRVVDASTGKPIEGVIVDYTWTLSGILGDTSLTVGAFCETITNRKGEYSIPSQRIKRQSFVWESPKAEIAVIYKRGYGAYQFYGPLRDYDGDRAQSFLRPGEYQDYRKRGNLVRLYRWEEGASVQQHLEWIHNGLSYVPRRTLLQEELESERSKINK